MKSILEWAHELAVIFLAGIVMSVVASIAADIWPNNAEKINRIIGFLFGMWAWMLVEKMRK